MGSRSSTWEANGWGMPSSMMPAHGHVGRSAVRNIPITSPDASRNFGMTWDTWRRLIPVAAAFFEHAQELGSRYPGWANLLDS